ncbi:hypothetical protein DV515_00018371 [Chloebia gouldiae]|uniref:G-protein coupled receptors family 1 profile domain-containing protein n=2 Tax=Passeriformes TaxID=9126 RepID=A0A3L8Q7P0_CHLGU|nr:hypothetical protein DV515_00018371 [Chloebia gouldiae]
MFPTLGCSRAEKEGWICTVASLPHCASSWDKSVLLPSLLLAGEAAQGGFLSAPSTDRRGFSKEASCCNQSLTRVCCPGTAASTLIQREAPGEAEGGQSLSWHNGSLTQRSWGDNRVCLGWLPAFRLPANFCPRVGGWGCGVHSWLSPTHLQHNCPGRRVKDSFSSSWQCLALGAQGGCQEHTLSSGLCWSCCPQSWSSPTEITAICWENPTFGQLGNSKTPSRVCPECGGGSVEFPHRDSEGFSELDFPSGRELGCPKASPNNPEGPGSPLSAPPSLAADCWNICQRGCCVQLLELRDAGRVWPLTCWPRCQVPPAGAPAVAQKAGMAEHGAVSLRQKRELSGCHFRFILSPPLPTAPPHPHPSPTSSIGISASFSGWHLHIPTPTPPCGLDAPLPREKSLPHSGSSSSLAGLAGSITVLGSCSAAPDGSGCSSGALGLRGQVCREPSSAAGWQLNLGGPQHPQHLEHPGVLSIPSIQGILGTEQPWHLEYPGMQSIPSTRTSGYPEHPAIPGILRSLPSSSSPASRSRIQGHPRAGAFTGTAVSNGEGTLVLLIGSWECQPALMGEERERRRREGRTDTEWREMILLPWPWLRWRKSPAQSQPCPRLLMEGDLGAPNASVLGEHSLLVGSSWVAAFLCFIILLTTAGNFLLILLIVTQRSLRNTSNYFLVSLFMSDLMVGLVVMPPAMLNQLYGRWVLRGDFCSLWASFDVMCCSASILNLCVISLDRYLLITSPLRYKLRMTSCRALALILAAWTLAALASFLPIKMGWHELEFEVRPLNVSGRGDEDQCRLLVSLPYALVASCLTFFLPSAAISFTYCRILLAARKQAVQVASLASNVATTDEATPQVRLLWQTPQFGCLGCFCLLDGLGVGASFDNCRERDFRQHPPP